MKNLKVGHRPNFEDKLIVNLHLLFPVRSISRGSVISPDITADYTRANSNSMFVVLRDRRNVLSK